MKLKLLVLLPFQLFCFIWRMETVESSNTTLAPREGLFLTQLTRWLQISYLVLTQSGTKLRSLVALPQKLTLLTPVTPQCLGYNIYFLI